MVIGPGLKLPQYMDLYDFYQKLGKTIFKDSWDEEEYKFRDQLIKYEASIEERGSTALIFTSNWLNDLETVLDNSELINNIADIRNKHIQWYEIKEYLLAKAKEDVLRQIEIKEQSSKHFSISAHVNISDYNFTPQNKDPEENYEKAYEVIYNFFENNIEYGLRYYFTYCYMKRIFFNSKICMHIFGLKTYLKKLILAIGSEEKTYG
ncbi:MAG: hypothetical protein K1X44_06500 [Alphaproteobacteria bacterium]|nr:hypothetical protein [Alphaproteobacteria bacterium]